VIDFGVDFSRIARDIFVKPLFKRRTAGLTIGAPSPIRAFGRIGMRKLAFLLAAILSVAVVSAPVLAHHGEANYDTEKTVSIKGTVTDFQFVNPHVQITLEVKNDKGEIEKWVGEARSPAMLARYGNWDKNTIKVGDVITFYGHRTKNGTPFMRLEKIVKADGTELPNL
jgi:hypothetical protein